MNDVKINIEVKNVFMRVFFPKIRDESIREIDIFLSSWYSKL